MQQHRAHPRLENWEWVQLHFLIIGSDVGNPGPLQKRSVYRTRTPYWQELTRPGNKKARPETFLPGSCVDSRGSNDCTQVLWFSGSENRISSSICSGIKLEVRIAVWPIFVKGVGAIIRNNIWGFRNQRKLALPEGLTWNLRPISFVFQSIAFQRGNRYSKQKQCWTFSGFEALSGFQLWDKDNVSWV